MLPSKQILAKSLKLSEYMALNLDSKPNAVDEIIQIGRSSGANTLLIFEIIASFELSNI